MNNLDDLISYENENSSLDFKAIQYTKDQHESFIKDILSMANADVDGEKYIIIGVKYKNCNDREIIGIEMEKFVDSSKYQQLVRENIEPEINIDYFSHEMDGKYLGILKIESCNNKPYYMKKDFRNLKKGDCFIRKGSSQDKMIREDFDRIIAKRISSNCFKGKVKIYFSDYPQDKEITLQTANDIELPSERAAIKILKLIEEKKRLPAENPYINFTSSPLFPVPYENRSIVELEKNLKNIKKTFKDQDCYEFYELRSHKLNITIINESDAYIEDAQFQIDVDKMDGLFISKEIFRKPKDPSDYSYGIPDLDWGRYPEVEDKGSYFRIYNSSMLGRLGKWDIKHQIPQEIFLEPVRLLFLKNLAGEVIQLKCRLYGKNLKEPIEENLKIKVDSSQTAQSAASSGESNFK